MKYNNNKKSIYIFGGFLFGFLLEVLIFTPIKMRFGQAGLGAPSNLSTIFAALLLALLCLDRRGKFYLLIPFIYCEVFFVLTPVIYSFIDRLQWPLQSPSASIGQSLYFGYSKIAEQVKFYMTLIFSAGCGIFAGFFARHFPSENLEEVPLEGGLKIPIITFALLFLCFVILNFPDLGAYTKMLLESRLHIGDFDKLNFITWDYLALNGYLPYKDYWFPYGGNYFTLGITNQNLLWKFLQQVILFIFSSYVIYALCNRRLLPTIIILSLLGLFIDLEVITGTKRYLLCFTTVGLFYAVTSLKKLKSRNFVVFGIYLGWCFSQDVFQVIYSIFPLCIILIFGFSKAKQEHETGKFVWCLLYSLFAFLGSAGIYLWQLHASGQLKAFLDFYLNLNPVLVSSSAPASIDDWALQRWSWESLCFFGLNLLLLITVQYYINFKDEPHKNLWKATFIIFISALILYQKMLIRPYMADQILCFIFLGLGIYVANYTWGLSFSHATTVSALLGLFFAKFYINFNLDEYFLEKSHNLRDLKNNLSIAISTPNTDQAAIMKYYSAENLTGVSFDHKSAIEYLNKKILGGSNRNIFVLGDDSFYYIALRQTPCPYISIYDTSGLLAQKKQIQCLNESRPKYVIWDSSHKTFDNVPNIVKVPVIFDYIISNYTPEISFNNVHILRRTGTEEQPSAAFWFSNLGSKIHLGALPWASTFLKRKNCCTAVNCSSFAVLEKQMKGIKISDDEHDLYIYLIKPHKASVNPTLLPVISLDHIWFFNLASKLGKRIEIHSLPENLPLKIEKRQYDPDVFY